MSNTTYNNGSPTQHTQESPGGLMARVKNPLVTGFVGLCVGLFIGIAVALAMCLPMSVKKDTEGQDAEVGAQHHAPIYRINAAGCFVVNQQQRVLFVSKQSSHDHARYLSIPGGGFDAHLDLNLKEAAQRGTMAEAGYEVVAVKLLKSYVGMTPEGINPVVTFHLYHCVLKHQEHDTAPSGTHTEATWVDVTQHEPQPWMAPDRIPDYITFQSQFKASD